LVNGARKTKTQNGDMCSGIKSANGGRGEEGEKEKIGKKEPIK